MCLDDSLFCTAACCAAACEEDKGGKSEAGAAALVGEVTSARVTGSVTVGRIFQHVSGYRDGRAKANRTSRETIHALSQHTRASLSEMRYRTPP